MASTSKPKSRVERLRHQASALLGRTHKFPWRRPAKVRMGILLWALGVPIPIILIYLLLRGCA